MVKKETVNNIEDIELKNLLIKFDSMKGITSPGFRKIMPSDNDYLSLLIKSDLAMFLYKRLVNDKLIDAFNISKDLKYYRMQEIANLVSNSLNNDLYFIFKDIIWTDKSDNKYDDIIRFILSQSFFHDKNILKKIQDFSKDKETEWSLYNTKSVYLPLDEEIKRLKEFIKYKDDGCNLAPKHFADYVKDYLSISRNTYGIETKEESDKLINKLLNNYQNKRTGNIGEYYTQNMLERRGFNPIFVSKNYGDELGYDHHVLDKNKEKLIDSKATLIDSSIISISKGEYKVLEDCIDQSKRSYFVSRISINRDSCAFKNMTILKTKDIRTLVPYNEDNDYSVVFKYDHDDDRGSKIFIKQ